MYLAPERIDQELKSWNIKFNHILNSSFVLHLSSLRFPMPHFSYLDRVIPAELVQNPSGLCADGDEFLFI
jgi:hypothetical protein